MEPGRAVERNPDRTLPHLVVSDVGPAVAAGRYAVKRLVGEGLRIGADIFTDGHDLLAARVVYVAPGERRTQSVPMTYSFEDDRWYATLALDRVGEWRFGVEAWVDRLRAGTITTGSPPSRRSSRIVRPTAPRASVRRSRRSFRHSWPVTASPTA
jgi:starch synthase (maltosyl-transferring)